MKSADLPEESSESIVVECELEKRVGVALCDP